MNKGKVLQSLCLTICLLDVGGTAESYARQEIQPLPNFSDITFKKKILSLVERMNLPKSDFSDETLHMDFAFAEFCRMPENMKPRFMMANAAEFKTREARERWKASLISQCNVRLFTEKSQTSDIYWVVYNGPRAASSPSRLTYSEGPSVLNILVLPRQTEDEAFPDIAARLARSTN